MMRFVKDEKIDTVNADEAMTETVMQNGRSADNHLVLPKMLLPCCFGPEIGAHVSAKGNGRLVEIRFDDAMLLKNQRDFVHLRMHLAPSIKLKCFAYQEESYA